MSYSLHTNKRTGTCLWASVLMILLSRLRAKTLYVANSWTHFLLEREVFLGNYLDKLLGVDGGP